MPGQPGPVYPPGQFSPWNRPSVRASWLGLHREGTWESDAEPGYSVLATSDPSADATATQTWATIDETGDWAPPPLARDVSAHTDGEGFPRVRRADPRAAAPRAAFEAAARAAAAGTAAGVRQPAPWEAASPPASGQRGGPAGPGTAGGTAPAGPDAPAAPAGGPAPPGRRGAPAGPRETGGQPAADRAGARHGQRAPRGGEPRRQGGDRRAAATVASHQDGGTGHAAATAASRQDGGSGRAAATAAGRPDGGTGHAAGRRSGGRTKPSHRALILLLLAPVVVVIVVVAAIVYRGSRPLSTATHGAAAATKRAAAPTPAQTLGPWRNIASQAVDTQPLSLHELYSARFSAGGSAGVKTVQKANTKCTNAVVGSSLRAAVRKGGCTQVMRASYLSANKKIMATIGVLNLVDVAAAEKAGKAAGASQYIRQLPGSHGPTRNLTKGTGLVEAEVKGHYLILIWTEFANQHAPKGKKQRKELTSFSADLFAGTVNVSLTSRMVTGKPANP
ncbi:MAG TPA: hypothetical protein VKD66_07720 [Streptosporangiaceae bacterium]|nr:hypothetical protein [Streptosporangiaceae bacterium]